MTDISRRCMIGGSVAVLATLVAGETASAASQFRVGDAIDYPVGTIVLVTIPKKTWFGKKKVSLLSTAKGFFAFEATCTHEPYLMRLSGKKLVCNKHGAAFNTKTGAPIYGPTRRSLTKYSVTVTDGVVYLTI